MMHGAARRQSDWRELYDNIGEMLFAGNLEPTSPHFDLCRRYWTRSDPAIAKAIDDEIQRHGALNSAAVANVLAVFGREMQVDDSLAVMRDTHGRVEAAAEIVREAGEHSRQYGTALAEGGRALKSAESPGEVIDQLIAVTQEMTGRVNAAEEELRQMGEEIDSLRVKLAEAARNANSDPLTGLPNRRALNSRLDTAFATAREQKTPFSVAICDIDHFKKVNDTYGHDIGDEVIKFVAQSLSKVGPNNLFVARYGGEEFVIVFENTLPADAMNQLDAVRTEIAARQLTVKSSGQSLGRISFSGGVSGITGKRDPSAMLKAADNALYRAKEMGRNRICLGE